MSKPVNEKCKACASGAIKRCDQYDRVKCGRKRSYYRSHKANKEWMQYRHRYLKHKGDRCVMCRKGAHEAQLYVHHIVPQHDGGGDSPSNLLTLCWECHVNAHRYIAAVEQKQADGTPNRNTKEPQKRSRSPWPAGWEPLYCPMGTA